MKVDEDCKGAKFFFLIVLKNFYNSMQMNSEKEYF